MMKLRLIMILLFSVIYFGCKTNKSNKSIAEPFEESQYSNSNSEASTVNNILNSKRLKNSTLVIYLGKEMSMDKFNSTIGSLDSTFTFNIIKDSSEICKYHVKSDIKTLIIIDKIK